MPLNKNSQAELRLNVYNLGEISIPLEQKKGYDDIDPSADCQKLLTKLRKEETTDKITDKIAGELVFSHYIDWDKQSLLSVDENNFRGVVNSLALFSLKKIKSFIDSKKIQTDLKPEPYGPKEPSKDIDFASNYQSAIATLSNPINLKIKALNRILGPKIQDLELSLRRS